MRKLLFLPVLLALVFTSCKKKEGTVSSVETASFPTITITSGLYYSVQQYALYPNLTVSVTDSFYNPTSYVVIDSAIHTNVPGLYIGTVSARNKEGFTTYVPFYVAVTNISDSLNLSGTWWLSGANRPLDSISSTQITELANGLYTTSNAGGDSITSSSVSQAIFAVTNTTTIVFPANANYYSPGTLSMIPGDTTISYVSATTGATITYKKQ